MIGGYWDMRIFGGPKRGWKEVLGLISGFTGLFSGFIFWVYLLGLSVSFLSLFSRLIVSIYLLHLFYW